MNLWYNIVMKKIGIKLADGSFHTLLEEGVPPNCTAMQAIGYKETAAALRGELSRAGAIAL